MSEIDDYLTALVALERTDNRLKRFARAAKTVAQHAAESPERLKFTGLTPDLPDADVEIDPNDWATAQQIQNILGQRATQANAALNAHGKRYRKSREQRCVSCARR